MTARIYPKEQGVSKPLVLTIIGSLAIWMVIFLNYSQGHKLEDKYSELIHATMEIKLETAYAHLWFEEIMAGDSTQNLDEVMTHLDSAIWYVNAILNGGIKSGDVYFAIQDEKLRIDTNKLLNNLHQFKTLTNERHTHFKTSLAGSEIEIQYDHTFRKLISDTTKIENSLRVIIENQLTQYGGLHLIASVIVLLLASWATLRIKIESKLKRNKSLTEQLHHEELDISSHTDPVTGIANRRAFDEKLDMDFKIAMRSNQPLSLMLIELDYFKDYQDEVGKEQANKSLTSIAASLQNTCNSSIELVCRYRDGFAAIVPNNTQYAKRTAESMLQAINNSAIRNPKSPISENITLSIGLVEMDPEEGIMLPQELIATANNALNQAIKNGRNSVFEIDPKPDPMVDELKAIVSTPDQENV